MKKRVFLAIILLATITSTFAYVQTMYNLSTEQQETVEIGNTTVVEEGITVSLATYDNYNLTYFTVAETSMDKHYLTYSYNYSVIAGYDVVVSSLSNDIVIDSVVYGDTIDITFSLNQEADFNEGDVITIRFLFELVKGININNATYDQLVSLGFDDREATEISNLTYQVNNLDELYGMIYIANIHERFDDLVSDGTIVFN